MYRTAEQDARLKELYIERDRVCDYAASHNVDVSLALSEIDKEIEFLTAGIGEMACQKCAAKSLNDMTQEEQAEWFASAEPIDWPWTQEDYQEEILNRYPERRL